MIFADSVAVTNRGIFIPSPAWGDGAVLLGIVAVLSILGAFLYRRYAKKVLFDTGRLMPMTWPALAIAFVPSLVVYFGLSMTLGNTEMRLVGANAAPDQSLAAYADDQGALTVCMTRDSAALNVQRLLRGGDLRYTENVFDNEGSTLEAFRRGECNLVAVRSDFTERFLNGTDIPAATLAETTVRGGPLDFERPVLGGFNFEGGIQLRNSLIALWFALALYTGAFIAEIVRAGILSVSKGQSEAAFALGMRPNRTMNLVILPQALRVIIPPLISQFLNLTKNSSLAIAVGYMDVRATLGGITINQTGRELEGMLLLGMFYLALSLVISSLMNVYNSRTKLKER